MRRLSMTFNGEARTVDVRDVPAGVNDGGRVRIAGEGERGANGGKAGDLYLRLRIRLIRTSSARDAISTPTFRSPLTTAVLGGEVEGEDARRQSAAL